MEEEPVLWGSGIAHLGIAGEGLELGGRNASFCGSPQRTTVPHEVSRDSHGQEQPSVTKPQFPEEYPTKEPEHSSAAAGSTPAGLLSQGGASTTIHAQGGEPLVSGAVGSAPNQSTNRTRTARAKSVILEWVQKELGLLQESLNVSPTPFFDLLDRVSERVQEEEGGGSGVAGMGQSPSSKWSSMESRSILLQVVGRKQRNSSTVPDTSEPMERRGSGQFLAVAGSTVPPTTGSTSNNNSSGSGGALGRIVAQCLLGGANTLSQCFPNQADPLSVAAVMKASSSRETKKRPVGYVGKPPAAAAVGAVATGGSLRNFSKKVQALMHANDELQRELQSQQPQLRKDVEDIFFALEKTETVLSPEAAPNAMSGWPTGGGVPAPTAKERLQIVLETLDNCFVLCKHILTVLGCVFALCNGLPLPVDDDSQSSQAVLRTHRKRVRHGVEAVGDDGGPVTDNNPLVESLPTRSDLGSSTSVQTDAETVKSATNANPTNHWPRPFGAVPTRRTQLWSYSPPKGKMQNASESDSDDETDSDCSSSGSSVCTDPSSSAGIVAAAEKFRPNRGQRRRYREFELSLHRVMMSLQAVNQLKSYAPGSSQAVLLTSRSASSYSQVTEPSRLSNLIPDSFTLAPIFAPWVGVPCHEARGTCPDLPAVQHRYLKKIQTISRILLAVDLAVFRCRAPDAPGAKVPLRVAVGAATVGQRTALVVPLTGCDVPPARTPFVETAAVGRAPGASSTALQSSYYTQNSQSRSVTFTMQTSPPMSQGPPPTAGGSFDFLSAPVPQPPPPVVVSRRNQKLLTHLHLQRQSDNVDVTGFLARRGVVGVGHLVGENEDGRMDSEGDDTVSMMDSASGTAGPRSRNLSPTMPLCPPFFPQASNSMSILSLDGGSRVGGGGPSATGNGLPTGHSQPTFSQQQQQLGKSQVKVQHREIPSWMQSKRKTVAPTSILAAAKHRVTTAGSPRTKASGTGFGVHHSVLNRSNEVGLFSPTRRSTLAVKPTPERTGRGESKLAGRMSHEDPSAPGWMTGVPVTGSLLMGLESGPTERSLLFDDAPLVPSSPLLLGHTSSDGQHRRDGASNSSIGVPNNDCRRMAGSPRRPHSVSRKRDAGSSAEESPFSASVLAPTVVGSGPGAGVGVSTPMRNPVRFGHPARDAASLLFIPPTP